MAKLTDELAAQHLIGDVCPVCEEAAATVIVELNVHADDHRAVLCPACAGTLAETFDYVTGGGNAKAG